MPLPVNEIFVNFPAILSPIEPHVKFPHGKWSIKVYSFNIQFLISVQFSSLSQSCLTLCDPMDCSTPGFPVCHQLPELTQTHVHPGQWCHPTISSSVVPFSSCLQSFPASGSFQMNQFFVSGDQSIGVLASASVLPMNIQDWFPLGWTGWICLLFKRLPRVFSNTSSK